MYQKWNMFKNIFKKIKHLFIKEIDRPPFVLEVKIPNKRTIHLFKFYIPKFIFVSKSDLSKDERESNRQTIRNMVHILGVNRTIEVFNSKRFMYRLLKENHINLNAYREIRIHLNYGSNPSLMSSWKVLEIVYFYKNLKNYINIKCK